MRYLLAVSWGHTRFVILAGPWAIKIARPNVRHMIRAPIRFLQHKKHKTTGTALNHYSSDRKTAIIRYLFRGTRANFLDWQYGKNFPDFCARVVLRSPLNFVVIQERGEQVTAEEAKAHQMWPAMLMEHQSSTNAERSAVGQFARFPDGLKVVDTAFICPLVRNLV